MLGAFTELGPYFYTFNETGELTDDKFHMDFNENAWNNHANVLFVDQPLGTGFSFTDGFKHMRKKESDIALDFERFLRGFYEKYPEYQKNDLYLAGESFAGQYIPAIASHLFTDTEI